MNVNSVIKLLQAECRKYGGEAQFAKAIGVSRQQVYAVLAGDRPPRGRILDVLGLEAVIEYRRKRGQ
jgi:hypothetical protein